MVGNKKPRIETLTTTVKPYEDQMIIIKHYSNEFGLNRTYCIKFMCFVSLTTYRRFYKRCVFIQNSLTDKKRKTVKPKDHIPFRISPQLLGKIIDFAEEFDIRKRDNININRTIKELIDLYNYCRVTDTV